MKTATIAMPYKTKRILTTKLSINDDIFFDKVPFSTMQMNSCANINNKKEEIIKNMAVMNTALLNY